MSASCDRVVGVDKITTFLKDEFCMENIKSTLLLISGLFVFFSSILLFSIMYKIILQHLFHISQGVELASIGIIILTIIIFSV